MAVDSNHIYWADSTRTPSAEPTSNGQNVNPSFIAVPSYPFDVAVDSAHIYWTNTTCSIGRADLDGQNVNNIFISLGGYSHRGSGRL